MAQAKAGPRRTTREVTLHLTEGEADLVLAVLAAVGGEPGKSPRKYAVRISNALSAALGYNCEGTDALPLLEGDLRFRNYGSDPVTPLERVSNTQFGDELENFFSWIPALDVVLVAE